MLAQKKCLESVWIDGGKVIFTYLWIVSPDWLLYDFPHVWHLNGFLQSSPVPAFSWTFWMCRRRLNFCGNVFWQKGHIRWAFLWKSLIWLWKKTHQGLVKKSVHADYHKLKFDRVCFLGFWTQFIKCFSSWLFGRAILSGGHLQSLTSRAFWFV